MAVSVAESLLMAAPRLMLMMSAPLSAAKYRAFWMLLKYMLPALLATFSGMILALGQAPAAPRPLFTLAAATPAQAVPWPALLLSSSGLLSLSP